MANMRQSFLIDEWCTLKKSAMGSALFLCLVSASFVSSAAAGPACFTSDEAKAAHLRIMQQEFNVAALNCRTVDPSDPGFDSRYNAFISKFGSALQANAQALRRHFARAGGNMDVWMTHVANEHGQRVSIDPQFCQEAWDYLDKALVTEVAEVEALATTLTVSSSTVPECSAETATPTKQKKAKVVKAAAVKSE
jgi:hypothetical protein